MDKLLSKLKKVWGYMAIFISNALYLAHVVRNRPQIGWSSFYLPSGVSASETEEGYSAAAVWSGDTYSKWKSPPSGMTSFERSLTFTKSGTGVIDYLGIAGHNMGDNGISYQLFSSLDGVSWSAVFPARIPADNKSIIEYFDTNIDLYFILVFVVPALTDGIVIAHVKLGKILHLQRPRYVGDVPGGMDNKVEKIASKSYSGQHLGSVLISQGNSFKITQENNTAAFCRCSALQNFFKHAHLLQKLSDGPTETFFYAWRPEGYPLEVQYCGETTSFSPPTNQLANGMMQWSMGGDAYE
ncbi:MAG: hypothetical protein V4493_01715 [Pseudomonadota bacterium]